MTTLIEHQALSRLQEEYKFAFMHFEGPISVTRVTAIHEFSAVGMDGITQSCEVFYFEVHKTLNNQPVAYFPSDSYVPDVIETHLRASRFVFPAPVRRILGVDVFSRSMTFPYRQKTDTPSAEQVRAVLEAVDAKRHKFRVKEDKYERAACTEVEAPRRPKTRKKFSIKKIEGEVQENPIKPLNPEQCHLISSRKIALQAVNQVVFSRSALKEIFDHIGFGKNTATNVVEQGGVYVGKPCVLPSGERLGYVTAAIAAPNTQGTSTYVEFSHDTWRYFLDVLEKMKENGASGSEEVILGWYHTHPNSLDVFMSGTDMGTQREQFHRKWNSAVVINPHRKLIAGFYGKDATPADVFLYQD